MSYNGSGTFLINSAGQPVVANTVISATVFNALTSDLATGLSTAITKDGQTTITANIPFGSNKITGLGSGTAATDAANLGQVQSTAAKLITVTGTDTITGSMSPALTAYAAGQLFYFVSAGANTGPVTINIDSLGAKSITRDGSTALAAGDINSGEVVVVIYDGTRFQMINAANSFGNTTINGTLTVTGNTGLQANVSITSTLSVGGTFAVTGAATLGSTLAVTGKSDLPTVSTASVNAAVAAITTATVTNLTATSASVASVNAGVALLTTATVTNLTATGASITSANIGNLQFTAASIASINAGVAVITNLSATSASIASMNAGVSLLTTATVTNLTASGASIASANIGNLQFTAASIASINAGVAVITNLTATGASIASANVGTAVITAATVTGASIASANVGTAVITTGTVTALTATGASVASANVGTAVVTGLTVTGASIASINVGAAVLSGNLTLNGGTVNGVVYLNASKVATTGSSITFDGANLSLTELSATVKTINVETANLKSNNGTQAIALANTSGIATFSANPILSAGTANGVLYLDGSKVATSGSALYFDGTNLGVGTTSPSAKLHVATSSGVGALIGNSDATNGFGLKITAGGSASSRYALHVLDPTDTTSYLIVSTATGSVGNVGIGTASPSSPLTVQSNASALSVNLIGRSAGQEEAWFRFYKNNGSTINCGILGDNQGLKFGMGSGLTEIARFDTSGNLGLGVTPSAWNSGAKAFQLGTTGSFWGLSGQSRIGNNVYYDTGASFRYLTTAAATDFSQAGGEFYWFQAASGTAGNAITFTQAMTLDASGNLQLGTTTANGRLSIVAPSQPVSGGDVSNVTVFSSDSQGINLGGSISLGGNADVAIQFAKISGRKENSTSNNRNGYLQFATFLDGVGLAERARITSGGAFLVGKTTDALSTAGFVVASTGETGITRDDGTALYINRLTSDGDLIEFRQANATEGSISVSGNTVSYNAFAGSHWSQLQDGNKPDILRGTVMESINELCEWPDEQNERLPKSKISDTAGSKKVYGVFMAWDNDWTATNDMLITAVGAFICRVNSSVTVQEGDLLESSGDGTARVQADDIIRSSTIGKVTSTVKTHQYDDGSYCVPTVLYCG